jgi:hypothetical protein
VQYSLVLKKVDQQGDMVSPDRGEYILLAELLIPDAKTSQTAYSCVALRTAR